MAKTQCASGDRRDRTRLGRSEPAPRPLEVADSVHFVLIGCVPASNRRARRHADAGPTQSAASPTVRLTSPGRQQARRRELPRRRPLGLRRARSPPRRFSRSRPAKRAEPARLAGDRFRLLRGFSATRPQLSGTFIRRNHRRAPTSTADVNLSLPTNERSPERPHRLAASQPGGARELRAAAPGLGDGGTTAVLLRGRDEHAAPFGGQSADLARLISDEEIGGVVRARRRRRALRVGEGELVACRS